MALSFVDDPHGYLGTDTGGKVATLQVMKGRGHLDPDIGYWAARWDPSGRLHPLYSTAHLSHRWVNVTTLPALYAAYPLFRLGGYRAALLVPMLGAVLAALAARALARRLGADDRWGWAAFWVVGLASPITVYALDFWEHSLGVALVAWGAVLLVDLVERRAGWRGALGAGLLFGAAATMRTEALVYAAVGTGAACLVVLVRRRSVGAAIAAGLLVTAGLGVPLLLNNVLERHTIGSTLRAERAAGTVGNAVSGRTDEVTAHASRTKEAGLTAVGVDPDQRAQSYLLGLGLLALLAFAAVRAGPGRDPGPAVLAGVGAAAVYVIRFADGLGFVPGLVAATPLAAVGLARGWTTPARRAVAAVALVALPFVWRFQFPGGAAPQWAGRYILVTGFVLGTLGVVALARLAPWARLGAVALAVAVTAFGVSWLVERSHDVGRAGRVLAHAPEPVLVSRIAHLARETGWYYRDHRWLTAVNATDEAHAVEVVTAAGYDRLGLVELDALAKPHELAGFHPTGRRLVPFFSGLPLRVTTYQRDGT